MASIPDPESFDAQVASVAALAEPVRRALYRYVIAQPHPVGREQAAAGVGVAHHVAKFHLDRLEEDGLLEVEFSRPPGRGGPGAGRPAKLYRRAARDIVVSLPQRRYDLVGRLFAQAITTAAESGARLADAVREAATSAGRTIGEQARRRIGRRAATLTGITEVLAELGYEPRREHGEIVMSNCPFHTLAQDYTALVCGANLDLINGLLDGVGQTNLHARLDPGACRCCVTIARSTAD